MPRRTSARTLAEKSMKTKIIAIISFALGIGITSFVCGQLRRADDIARRSATDWPTALMITAINGDVRSNRLEEARAKLQKLDKNYRAFCDGGATPEMFCREVMTTNR